MGDQLDLLYQEYESMGFLVDGSKPSSFIRLCKEKESFLFVFVVVLNKANENLVKIYCSNKNL